MTGDHADARTGRGERQPLPWRLGTPLVVLLSGALFVVSGINSGGTDLRPGRYTDLPGLAKAERADYERLEERRNALNAEVDELTGDVSGASIDRLRGQFEKLSDPAGLTPRQGSGIEIRLFDAPDEAFDAAAASEDSSYPEPHNLIVHQQDIQAVVNAMWAGGAEAITVAGRRLISTSGIQCKGSVVQIHGVPYPQPFVIKAVGDPTELRAAIVTDEWVAGYMAYAADERYRLGWSLKELDHIEAPAFSGSVDRQYAEPLG